MPYGLYTGKGDFYELFFKVLVTCFVVVFIKGEHRAVIGIVSFRGSVLSYRFVGQFSRHIVLWVGGIVLFQAVRDGECSFRGPTMQLMVVVVLFGDGL